MTRSRRRRVWRWVRRGALVVVALAVAIAIAAVVAIHTSWGRDVVRRRLVAALREVFRGQVSIGALEGSPFSTMVARDVVIKDAAGRPTIAIDRLSAHVHLWALTHHELHVSELEVRGVRVLARQDADGTIDLARLTRPDVPRRWSVTIDDAHVAGAALDARVGTRAVHLDDVELDGSASFPASGGLAVRAAVHARWRELGLPVAVTAQLRIDGDRIEVPHAQVALGELSLIVSSLELRGGRVSGLALAAATPRGVRALAPDAPLAGEVLLAARLSPVPRDEHRIALALGGVVGGAPIAGGAVLDPRGRRVLVTIGAQGVDGAAIARGAPRTALDLRVLADVAARPGAWGLAGLDGRLLVTAAGRVRDIRIDSLTVALAAHQGAIDTSVRAVGPGAAALAIAARLAIGGGHELSVDVRDARIAGRADAIEQIAPGLPVGGAIAIEARASGHLVPGVPALAIAGRVTGDGVSAAGFTARRAVVDLDGAGLPWHPAGQLRAELDGVARGGLPLLDLLVADGRSRPDGRIDVRTRSGPGGGAWQADADAIVDVAVGRVAIALGDHRVRTGGLSWAGRGGTIVVDRGTVAAHGVTSWVAGGRATIEGSLARDGPGAGDLTAHLEVAHVDLAAIDRALGGGVVGGGVVGGTAAISRTHGVVRARVDATARGVIARAGAPRLDGELHATLAPGDLALVARIAGDRVGSVALDVGLDAPHHPEDPHAWRALGRAALRHAALTVAAVGAAQLARLVGAPEVTAGKVDGALSFTGGAARGRLEARGLATRALPAAFDASVALSTDARGIAATLDARSPGRLVAHAELRAAAAAGALADLQAAHVHVSADLRDETIARWLAPLEPRHGRLTLDTDVGAGARTITARLALAGFEGRGVARPVDGEAVISAGADGVFGRATATFERGPLLAAQLGSPATPDAIVRALGAPGGLRAVPVHAFVTADRVPIASLLRVSGHDGDAAAGDVTLAATLGGSVDDPRVRVLATIDHLGRRDGVVDAHVTATYRARTIELAATGDEPGGGTLAITAQVALDRLDQASAHVQARRFELAPLARLAPASIGFGGVLDGDLRLTGDAAGGRLHVARAELPIDPQLGTLREGELTVSLDGGALAFDARGEVGRGTIEVHAKGALAGLVPTAATADVALRQITMLNPTKPTIDADVHVELRRDGDRWRADAVARDTLVTIADDSGAPLFPRDAPDDLVIMRGGARPPAPRVVAIGRRPARPRLVASLDLGRVRVESSIFRGWVQGRLTATAGSDAIAIEGAIEAGTADVTIVDRRHRVERAVVRFDGGVDPLLDIHLSYDFSSLTLYTAIGGRYSSPNIQLASDPASWSQSELLGFLMGGDPGRTGVAGVAGVSDVAAGVASALVAGKVKQLTKRYAGVAFDVLRLDSATATSSSAITVGKWLSRKLFVSYRQRLDARYDENQSEAQAEYWFAHHVVIDGSAGDRGVVGVDMVWTRRW